MSNVRQGVKRLRDQHAEATRAALVKAAVQRFSDDGHAGTSLDDIAADCGTTKGAVYHHFKDKKALYAAAYEHLSESLIAALAQDTRTTGPGVQGAINAFLSLATEDRYRRVLFVDGPAVLGSKACREIDMRYAKGLMTALVAQHTPPQLQAQMSTMVLTSMLLALLIEAAQLISAADDPQDTSRQVELLLKVAIGALTNAAGDQGASAIE